MASEAQKNSGRVIDSVIEAGWRRVNEIEGVPLWQWQETEMIRVLTSDDDVLQIIGAALNHCDQMSIREFNQFLAGHLFGGRSGYPSDEGERDEQTAGRQSELRRG